MAVPDATFAELLVLLDAVDQDLQAAETSLLTFGKAYEAAGGDALLNPGQRWMRAHLWVIQTDLRAAASHVVALASRLGDNASAEMRELF